MRRLGEGREKDFGSGSRIRLARSSCLSEKLATLSPIAQAAPASLSPNAVEVGHGDKVCRQSPRANGREVGNNCVLLKVWSRQLDEGRQNTSDVASLGVSMGGGSTLRKASSMGAQAPVVCNVVSEEGV